MKQRAAQLADHSKRRLRDGLRAVGYHTGETADVAYIRDDLVERYPQDRVRRFIEASQGIHEDLQKLDEGMGTAQASLHMMEEGLIIQFHYPQDGVVFLSMDREIGRNFTGFIDECLEQMERVENSS